MIDVYKIGGANEGKGSARTIINKKLRNELDSTLAKISLLVFGTIFTEEIIFPFLSLKSLKKF